MYAYLTTTQLYLHNELWPNCLEIQIANSRPTLLRKSCRQTIFYRHCNRRDIADPYASIPCLHFHHHSVIPSIFHSRHFVSQISPSI